MHGTPLMHEGVSSHIFAAGGSHNCPYCGSRACDHSSQQQQQCQQADAEATSVKAARGKQDRHGQQ